jgi:hypothetical protein
MNKHLLQLLRVEWMKVRNYTPFASLSLFFLIGIVAANYVVYSFKKSVVDPADPTGIISGTSPYDFDMVWQTTSYVAGYLLLLPGLLLIMLMTNEFSFRTHRQNIIDGWSRQQFIDVKICMALIAAVISTVVVFLTAFCFGLASGTSVSFTRMAPIGFFFLKALSYNMIALLIAVLVRKTGFAIGVFFIYLWFENFIAALLEIFSMKLKTEYRQDLGNLGDYLPMNASDGLLHMPSTTLSRIAQNSKLLPTDYWQLGLALAIIYLIVFVLWTRSRILKTDL